MSENTENGVSRTKMFIHGQQQVIGAVNSVGQTFTKFKLSQTLTSKGAHQTEQHEDETGDDLPSFEQLQQTHVDDA